MKLSGHRFVCASLMMVSLVFCACGQANPPRNGSHYVFLLPDEYTGWIQVVFAKSVFGKPVVEDGNLLVDLDDTGIFRTPAAQIVGGGHDEFFYKQGDAKGNVARVPVPNDYVCLNVSGLDSCYEPSEERGTDGFTVRRTTAGKDGSRSEGSSWFLFVGPPALRAKHAARVVFHQGAKYMEDHPENDPVPGRIKDAQSKQ